MPPLLPARPVQVSHFNPRVLHLAPVSPARRYSTLHLYLGVFLPTAAHVACFDLLGVTAVVGLEGLGLGLGRGFDVALEPALLSRRGGALAVEISACRDELESDGLPEQSRHSGEDLLGIESDVDAPSLAVGLDVLLDLLDASGHLGVLHLVLPDQHPQTVLSLEVHNPAIQSLDLPRYVLCHFRALPHVVHPVTRIFLPDRRKYLLFVDLEGFLDLSHNLYFALGQLFADIFFKPCQIVADVVLHPQPITFLVWSPSKAHTCW